MLKSVWRRRHPPILLVGMWRGGSLWRSLQKLKIELPYGLAVPLLGTRPEKIIIWKDTCPPVFTTAPRAVAEPRKQPWCLQTGVGGDAVYTPDGTLPTKTSEATSSLAAWMNLEIITLNGGIQTKIKRQRSYDITHMWNVNKWYKWRS